MYSDIRSHDEQNSEVSQVKYSDIRSHDHQNSEVSQVKYSDIRSNDHQNSEVSLVKYSDILNVFFITSKNLKSIMGLKWKSFSVNGVSHSDR